MEAVATNLLALHSVQGNCPPWHTVEGSFITKFFTETFVFKFNTSVLKFKKFVKLNTDNHQTGDQVEQRTWRDVEKRFVAHGRHQGAGETAVEGPQRRRLEGQDLVQMGAEPSTRRRVHSPENVRR